MKNIFLLTLIAVFLSVSLQAGNKKKPNIVFILVDDLGKEWVHTYGSEERLTPTIDKLAASGIQFENTYSCPQCTPTRATLMTGQYPFRHGWVNHWDVPRWGGGVHFDPESNPSVALAMKNAGYATCIAGKWQINDFRIQPEVLNQLGFDDYCMWTGYETGIKASAERYWDPYLHTKEGSRTYKGEFGDDVCTDFIIDFMKENQEKPFFVYYPMALTHGPLTTTPLDKNASGKKELFQAMVRYNDHLVNRIVNSLDELGLRENTIVIWTTDNGTSSSMSAMRNGRLVKGGKGKNIETGIDAPFIVNCPGLVPEGIKSEALIDFTDMFPTFVDLAGGKLPKEYKIDGVSAADVILGKSKKGKRDWILSMGGQPGRRAIDGWVVNQFKFRDRVIKNERYKLKVDTNREPISFYDLKTDPAEENNLISNLSAEQKKAYNKLWKVVSELPEEDENPHYNPLPKEEWYVKPGWGTKANK